MAFSGVLKGKFNRGQTEGSLPDGKGLLVCAMNIDVKENLTSTITGGEEGKAAVCQVNLKIWRQTKNHSFEKGFARIPDELLCRRAKVRWKSCLRVWLASFGKAGKTAMARLSHRRAFYNKSS